MCVCVCVYIIMDQHYATSSTFLHYKELYTVCWSVNFLSCSHLII